MSLDARTRASLYGKLRPILGDEDANSLMSEFPSTDADEVVTKQFLRAELAEGLGTLRAEMRQEIGGLRAEMHQEIGGLRSEMHQEIGGLRGEMHQEIGGLRAEMHRLHNRTVVEIGALIAVAGLVNHFLG